MAYDFQADTTTHNGALVWREATAIRHPDEPERGARRRIYFQAVPEGKIAELRAGRRIHLDIMPTDGSRDSARPSTRIIASPTARAG